MTEINSDTNNMSVRTAIGRDVAYNVVSVCGHCGRHTTIPMSRLFLAGVDDFVAIEGVAGDAAIATDSSVSGANTAVQAESVTAEQEEI